jgi:hypothetical protein
MIVAAFTSVPSDRQTPRSVTHETLVLLRISTPRASSLRWA